MHVSLLNVQIDRSLETVATHIAVYMNVLVESAVTFNSQCCAANHYVSRKLFRHVCYSLCSCVLVTVQPPRVKLTTGKNDRQVYLYVYLLIYQYQQLNVKLLEYISCIPLLNHLHVCSGIQLKSRTTFMYFLCELYCLMLGQQNTFQQIVILITLNISLRIRQMFIIKICSNCSNIVVRYIISKIHKMDSQCPLGHKLQ